MNSSFVKIGLIGLAVIASVGITVAVASSLKQTGSFGIFSRASSYGPDETPVVNAASDKAVITWTSKAPSISLVKYGTNATSPSIPQWEVDLTSTHKVTINGLVADTTYYYKIEAKGEAYPKEGTYQFRTLPKSSANQVYPACNLDTFKQYYGKARSDPGFNATYDINQDGIISTIDFFECLKVNPAK